MTTDEQMLRLMRAFPSFQAAEKAWDRGDVYFTPGIPATAPGFGSLNGDTGIGRQITYIESLGWRLHTWQVVGMRGGQPEAHPLFARPPR